MSTTKGCACCGHPNAQDYGEYKACSTCAPKSGVERIIEKVMRDNDNRSRKAKIRETTYRCSAAICSYNKRFAPSRIVIDWLED